MLSEISIISPNVGMCRYGLLGESCVRLKGEKKKRNSLEFVLSELFNNISQCGHVPVSAAKRNLCVSLERTSNVFSFEK